MPASSRYCGELLDHPLVERDRGLEAGGELLCGLGVGAGALFVERGEPEHRVGRALRVRVGAGVAGDEGLEAADGLFARVAQAFALGVDLHVEGAEQAPAAGPRSGAARCA